MTTGRAGSYAPLTGRTGRTDRIVADAFADPYADAYGPQTPVTIGPRSAHTAPARPTAAGSAPAPTAGATVSLPADLFADPYADLYGPLALVTIGARAGSFDPQEAP